MEKYIGFDIDDKKTVACVVQKGKKDRYDTMRTDVAVMKRWLARQRKPRAKLHLTFEVSGQAGWLYDQLRDSVDTLTVSNPSKMTWIYRTAKKSDRIDSRKQAILLQIGEIPKVHMPPPGDSAVAVADSTPSHTHRRSYAEQESDPEDIKKSWVSPTKM